jgi:hypothetical protein
VSENKDFVPDMIPVPFLHHFEVRNSSFVTLYYRFEAISLKIDHDRMLQLNWLENRLS